MFVGIPNPNILIPVEKMRITNLDAKDPRDKTIDVLYNPQTYTRTKSDNFRPISPPGSDAPIIQFHSGGMEQLSFELFFDSVSSGAEVGGTVVDRAKFAGNSLLPTIAGLVDVRDYTRKITNLMYILDDKHRPPELKVEWASLQFRGFLAQCQERFVRFDERGRPVRAFLSCVFIEHRENQKLVVANPLNSPDTTKYHTVRLGDSLWSLAAEEYGDPGEWRVIAEANGLSNPRRLKPGEMLVVPAII